MKTMLNPSVTNFHRKMSLSSTFQFFFLISWNSITDCFTDSQIPEGMNPRIEIYNIKRNINALDTFTIEDQQSRSFTKHCNNLYQRQTDEDHLVIQKIQQLKVLSGLSSMNDRLIYQSPEKGDFVQIIKHRLGEITFRYQRGRIIGKGGFGECYEARKYIGVSENEDINEVVVIKRQKIKNVNSSKQRAISRDKYRKEVRINKILNAASKFYFPKYKTYWQDQNYYYTVMQRIELGSLDSLIKPMNKFLDQQILYFIRQILKAIHLMHKEKMIHCDIKASNILVNKQMEIKIIDFGLSEVGLNSDPTATKRSGTPCYMAPEIVAKTGQQYSYSVDVWSIGILLHCMIYGRQLFPSRDHDKIYQQLKSEQKFLQRLEERKSEQNQHQQLKKSQQLMCQMLIYKPQSRPTVAALLDNEVFKDLNSQQIKSNLIAKYNSYIKQNMSSTSKWDKLPAIQRKLSLKSQYKVKILYLFRHEHYGYFYILSNGFIRAYFNDNQEIVFDQNKKSQDYSSKDTIVSQIYKYILEEKKIEFEYLDKIKKYSNKEQPNCQIVSLVQTNKNVFIRLSNGSLQVFFPPQKEYKQHEGDCFYSYELIVSVNNHKNQIQQISFESDDGEFYFKNFDHVNKQPIIKPQNRQYKQYKDRYYSYIVYIKKIMKIMLDNSQIHLHEYGCQRNYGQKK